MSRNSKKKKSTSKYRDFKVSPLIAVTALIEVVVLVVVSSFAWFYLSENKEVNIGTVSVDADSGLDIDFKYAKEDDYINIWNYVDKDFKFEPVTSLDGRNVYVPTSGTFDNTNTSDMVFREGTVNDINSKYINIDFELTNTTGYDMKVFLNNNSYFNVKHGNNKDESRALRLAFYPNDASTGKVTSQLIGTSSDYSGQEDTGSTTNKKTVYFDNTTWSGGQASKTWDKVYAYIWKDGGSEYAAWPGVEISRMSGSIYSYSFTDDGTGYDRIIYNSGVGNQTSDLTLTDGNVYKASTTGSGSKFKSRTVYFVKPENWENVYVHAWRNTNLNGTGTDQYYTNWDNGASGLDEMKSVGSGIYSYTFSYGDTAADRVYGLLFTNGTKSDSNHQYTQTVDIKGTNLADDTVYYVSGNSSGYKYSASPYSTLYSAMKPKTIYFYNSLGWDIPYINATIGTTTISLPMTTLNGNVYYINLPEIYSSIYFRNKANTYQTYSIPGNTDGVTLQAGYVYRPLNDKDGSGNYKMNAFKYADYTSENGYAVISPGVSAGFQRTYTPVVKINNDTGAAAEVIPAFSNSIDNYIFGNKAGAEDATTHQPTSQTVFEIGAKHMISLSMVIWLEGTDPACTAQAYAGNNIEMRLEFASSYTDTSVNPPEPHNVNTYGSETYKYKFYDKTREVWTSDRQATESGITVAPVMQLYDNTVKRGYLMSPESYVTVDGKPKVSCWSVDAPQNIALWGHDIIFRRVNPYDEDEVWNYWHAGRVAGAENDPVYTDRKNTNTYTVYSVATAGTTNTISFTAFADGSPTYDMLKNNGNATEAASASVPSVSCGGLWGNHNVRTLTAVDNTPFHGLGNDRGLVTISYEFQYSGGDKTRPVKIEYKSSGPYDGLFYYFVVPDVIYTSVDPFKFDARSKPSGYTKGLYCTYKRYYGYDSGYAINSDRNDELRYSGQSYGKNILPTGDYFQFNVSTAGTAAAIQCYYGSDLLYVQTTSKTSDYMLTGEDKDRLLQVQYKTSNNNYQYSYLYAADASLKKDATAPSVFVSVVANSLAYNQYCVQGVEWDNPNNHHYRTEYYPITSVNETIKDQFGSNNYTMRRSHLNQKNMITLDHMYIRLYVSIQKDSALLDGNNPKIYLWNGGTNNGWPGQTLTYDTYVPYDGGYHRYYIDFDVPKYTKFKIVKNSDSNTQSGDYSGTLDPDCSYNCYKIDGTGAPFYDTNVASTYSADKTLVVAANDSSTTNPHYSPRT